MENRELYELCDSELESISGGVAVGDVVRIRRDRLDYCSNCGKMLLEYEATITGVRGVLDGHTVYWITRNCCGFKSSEIETAFI